MSEADGATVPGTSGWATHGFPPFHVRFSVGSQGIVTADGLATDTVYEDCLRSQQSSATLLWPSRLNIREPGMKDDAALFECLTPIVKISWTIMRP